MAQPSELECPVCMETILPPLLQCSNGHHLCQRCTQRIRTSKRCNCNKPRCKSYGVKCPICRVDIAAAKTTEDKALETHALGDTVTIHACSYAPACPFTSAYAALVDHANTCTHKVAQETKEKEDAATAQHREAVQRQTFVSIFEDLIGSLAARRAQRTAQDAPYHVHGMNIPVAGAVDEVDEVEEVEDLMDDMTDLITTVILGALESDEDDEESSESNDAESASA